MKLLLENWREYRNMNKSPYDFFYHITKSSKDITINILDISTKEPVASKKSGTNAYISIEKRIDVPNWEVSWSSSPKNSERVGTIMYLMALELAGEKGLSPDSYETSPDAVRVWKKFIPKNNKFGVFKEKKEEFKYEGDENPFFFVFFKQNMSTLQQFSNKIIEKTPEKPEITEPDVKPFDPEEDWEEYVDLYEGI